MVQDSKSMPDCEIFLPGTPVMFEIPRSLEGKCPTYFRGYKEDHYIILDYPNNANGIPIPLKDQTPCIIRFIFAGKVYAFESEIIRAVRYPFPLVFIQYPQALANINLRNVERHSIRIPAIYSLQAMEEHQKGNQEGRLLDLSAAGCLLETTHAIEVETLLFLAFRLPNEERIQNLVAKVRRASKKEEAYHLGLQFMITEDPDIEKIKRYIAHLQSSPVQA